MSVLKIDFQGKTTIFTINRPEKMNAINAEVALGLQEGFEEFSASDQRVAIITGAGEKAFSSGGDASDQPEFWRCFPTVGITTEKPIICAVQGWCIGGALIMTALADLCVASEDARFSYPAGKRSGLGLTGGFLATLPLRIPHKLAMEILLLGEPVLARRALEIGLVNRVVANGKQVESALEWADRLGEMSPAVLATLKRFVVNGSLRRTPAELTALTQRDLWAVRNGSSRAEGT